MAKHASHDLKYGHFGELYYDTDERTWLNRRSPGTPCALQPLGSSYIVVEPLNVRHANEEAGSSSQQRKSKEELRTHISSVTRLDPSLMTASELVVQHAHLSKDITAISARHDPAIGDVMAMGRLADSSTRRPMSIAVFPATAFPATLRLVQIQLRKHGWDQNKSICIEVPQIDGEAGAWDAPAPIRQVCFADPVDSPPDAPQPLAVRTANGVSILRPAVRREIVSWDRTRNLPSRFDIAPVCMLSLEELEGVPPADVTFNPWYLQQIAVVDQQGTWRILEFNMRHPHQHGEPTEIARGAVDDQVVPDNAPEAKMLDDGWGRIVWAGDVHTIVIASRRSLGIFNIENKPVRLPSPDLEIAGTPHWILDVQTSAFDRSIIFVLTSVNLFCLQMKRLDMDDFESYSAAGAVILVQCRHLRDPEDISLRLSDYMDGEDLVLVIRSSLSTIANSYRFSFAQSSTSPFLQFSDPALLHLPDSTSDEPAILGVTFQPVNFAESVHHGASSGPGAAYRANGTKFFVTTAITRDLGIVQKLYYTTPRPNPTSQRIVPPHWKSRIVHSGPRLEQAGFTESDQATTLPSRDVQAPTRAFGQFPVRMDRRNWFLLYERSHSVLAQSHVFGGSDFSHVLQNIVLDSVREHVEDSEGFKLLADMCQDQVVVGDLDEAIAAFQTLFVEGRDAGGPQSQGNRESPTAARVMKLADGAVLGLHVQGNLDLDLTLVYNNIIERWLTPLPESVPGRLRLSKEQLARRVAADVCLASHALVSPKVTSQQDETQDFGERLDTQESEVPWSSQLSGFPTPSPTATPSLTTVTSLSSHPSTLVAPEFARLQRYATFTTGFPTPAPLPKVLANKLSHWSVGGDPDEYDWLATQRRQDEEAEMEEEGLTAKERARLKRRAEKHLRRQRRETARAQTMDLASSQAPEIISATQPTMVLPKRQIRDSGSMAIAASQGVALASSSQATPSQVVHIPASQIEPGRFGGRAKPPKKKRKTGF